MITAMRYLIGPMFVFNAQVFACSVVFKIPYSHELLGIFIAGNLANAGYAYYNRRIDESRQEI